jgi:hypothetical protein
MANRNPETGIAYGVVYAHNVPILHEKIVCNGTDESFESHKAECVKTIARALKECGQRHAEQQAKAIVDEFEWDDYQCDEAEYSYTDRDGNSFLLSYLGGAPLIWCLKTSVVTRARRCSPCVPGAGDLDNPSADGQECYGVPSDYVGDLD